MAILFLVSFYFGEFIQMNFIILELADVIMVFSPDYKQKSFCFSTCMFSIIIKNNEKLGSKRRNEDIYD